MYTIFQRTKISEPALFSPSDTTKRIENFPEVCISTFSDSIIEKFSSLPFTEKLSSIKERRQEGCLAVEMECASMLAVSKYRNIPFIQFLYGADNLSFETWGIRDLMSYGITNAEKYMVLAFECGLAM